MTENIRKIGKYSSHTHQYSKSSTNHMNAYEIIFREFSPLQTSLVVVFFLRRKKSKFIYNVVELFSVYVFLIFSYGLSVMNFIFRNPVENNQIFVAKGCVSSMWGPINVAFSGLEFYNLLVSSLIRIYSAILISLLSIFFAACTHSPSIFGWK